MPERIHFLDTDLNLTTRSELLGAIEKGETVRVATVNPEFMLEAEQNSRFREVLGRMTHCTIDGSGVLGILKMARSKLKIQQPLELYHGADFTEDLFQKYQDGSKSFFLLGGPIDLARTASSVLQSRYPNLRIVGATDGGSIDPTSPLSRSIEEQLRTAKPDIVLVGFGAPKQEFWIDAARDLPIQVMVGIGGTFGFYTTKKRAPHWMRALHLEWLFRSLTEKGHAKRAWRAVVVFPHHARRWLSTH